MLKLYDYGKSGNAYKVRLLLHQLDLPYERVNVDVIAGEAKTAAFAEINPNRRVPVAVWPDGRRLSESNAILFYLAESTEYLPDDSWPRALVLQWQSFEQYSHEPYIAVLRFWHMAELVDSNQGLIPGMVERGYRALDVMEGHLQRNDFFVGREYSVADISLYAYTHVANEGGFDLTRYPRIEKWLDRVRAQPRHIGIDA